MNDKPEIKKIYRSNDERLFAGVCGGIGEYFKVDAVIIRLAIVVFTILTGGTGIIFYLIAWLLIPRKPEFYY